MEGYESLRWRLPSSPVRFPSPSRRRGRDWSSPFPGFVERNANLSLTHHRTVDVPAIRFEDALTEVGISRCLKVDIEGLDMLCFRALRMFDERPDFVSLESAVLSLDAPLEKAFEQLAKLWSLCYRRFAYVDQSANPSSVRRRTRLGKVATSIRR